MSNLRVSTRNGWFRIVNSFHIALSMAHLTGNEYCVFGMLIRYTYGNVVRGNDGTLRGTDRCEWSIRIAAAESHLSKHSTENAWSSLVRKNLVVCYQSAAGQRPGVWGPNEEFWNWAHMPDHFCINDILKRSGPKFCVPLSLDANPLHCVPLSLDASEHLGAPDMGHKTSESGTQNSQKWDANLSRMPSSKAFASPPIQETRDKRQ